MLRLRVFSVVGCVLAGVAVLVQAQEPDLKGVIQKSIDAHGGGKNLAKFKAVNTKFKGTMQIAGLEAEVTGETSLQKPDKVKNVLTLNIAGKTIDVVTVFDGKKLWVKAMGETKEITDEKIVNSAREEMQTEAGGDLTMYLKPPYELNAIGDVKVKGKDAIGIRISKKGQKDISYFFDKKTYLVVKTETRTIDGATGQEITQEKFITAFQEKNGMKMAKRVEIVKDEKKFMEIEIIDVQPLEKLDDATFAKP